MVAFESYNYFGNNLYIDNVSIGLLTDIKDNYTISEPLVFPNPTSGIVNILLPEGTTKADLTIHNAQGSEVSRFTSKEKVITADLSNYNRGIFFARIVTDNGTYTQKIILE